MIDVADYIAIQDLYARYNHGSDAGDAEAYADCFTADGELQVALRKISVKGRANLIEYKNRDKASRGNQYRRHWNGSLALKRVDADTVQGRCYLLAYSGNPGDLPFMTSHGVYTDTIARENGEWKFRLRLLVIDGSAK